ncbi:Major Facilitator Superfamily [Popillia japonica]|uniref:Major Facilitator Superfamily n=1 Tax=Popillia japonica TaxID=7064 RepID=A0AAW1IVA1_POPJA
MIGETFETTTKYQSGDKNAEEHDPGRMTYYQKLKLVLKNITVEPLVICYILPSTMAMLTAQNLNIDKACRVNLKLDEEICDGIIARNASAYNTTDEEAIYKMVAKVNVYKNIVHGIIPSAVLLFLGSWSDRSGRRKPCILLPLIGEVSSCTAYLLCVYFFHQLPMEINAIPETVLPDLSGAWATMLVGSFTYVSQISTVEVRTLRIGAVHIAFNISFITGIALSGALYRVISYYGVFGLALLTQASALIYGVTCVKEVPKKIEDATRGRTSKMNFFDPRHVREYFRVAFKQDEKKRKKKICLIMVLILVVAGPVIGEMNVMYLLVRYKYGWSELDYSIYSTYSLCVHMLGTLISLLFFSKHLKLDDAVLGMLSSASKIASSFVFAFAPNSTVFYLAVLVEMLNGTSFVAFKSIISKLVPPEELGQINSLFGIFEGMVPLIYGPMYNYVYHQTISTFPGAFILLGGAMTIPAVIIFYWLYVQNKKEAKEEASNEALLSRKRLQDLSEKRQDRNESAV